MPPRTPIRREKPTILERIKNIFSISRPKKKLRPRPTHKGEGAHEGLPLIIASLEHSDDGVRRTFTPLLDPEDLGERRCRTESDFHRSQRQWLTENRLTPPSPPSPPSYDRPLPLPPPTYEDQDPIMGERLPSYTASTAHNDAGMLPSLNGERSAELDWIQFRQSHHSPPLLSDLMREGYPTGQ